MWEDGCWRVGQKSSFANISMIVWCPAASQSDVAAPTEDIFRNKDKLTHWIIHFHAAPHADRAWHRVFDQLVDRLSKKEKKIEFWSIKSPKHCRVYKILAAWLSRCFCVHAYFYAQFNFGECASLTSSPRTSSISLFSLSPGPMCRSVKSSCRGNILSICLEEMAAEVLRALTAASADDDGDGEQADAPRVRNLPWTFNARRLLAVRCRHGALGFADLAKKSPQDLAQLCISAISLKEGSINLKRCLALCRFLHRSLLESLLTPKKNPSLYNCIVSQNRTNQNAALCVTWSGRQIKKWRNFFFFDALQFSGLWSRWTKFGCSTLNLKLQRINFMQRKKCTQCPGT